jgi:diguanylate cyclase (GGDEF)-like protein
MTDDEGILWRLDRACRSLSEASGTYELAELACRSVVDFLGADAAELETTDGGYSAGAHRGPPSGLRPLSTPIGHVGSLRWWRSKHPDLTEAESLGLDILSGRIAVELEHARLLDSAESDTLRDALTGVLNRAGALHAMTELRPPWALALLDIDGMRHVNDKFGTVEGDRVLQRMALVLMQGRFGDIVARWGGDEFVVVLPGADGSGAANRLRRVLERVQETVRTAVQPVTFSCGIAVADGEGLDRALASADQALYTAKQSGPGTIVVRG